MQRQNVSMEILKPHNSSFDFLPVRNENQRASSYTPLRPSTYNQMPASSNISVYDSNHKYIKQSRTKQDQHDFFVSNTSSMASRSHSADHIAQPEIIQNGSIGHAALRAPRNPMKIKQPPFNKPGFELHPVSHHV